MAASIPVAMLLPRVKKARVAAQVPAQAAPDAAAATQENPALAEI